MNNLYKAIEAKFNKVDNHNNVKLSDVEDGILVQYTDDKGNLNWHVLGNTKKVCDWLSL